MTHRIRRNISFLSANAFLRKAIRLFLGITFFVSFSLFPTFSQAQNNQKALMFEALSLENGLSQSTVNTILQDNFGFIWAGTQDGLNRYDGYEFKIFRHSRRDTNSIKDNHVRSLFLDSEGLIWVGSDRSGISVFDYRKQNFKRYSPSNKGLSSGEINTFAEDKSGRIWIGTNRGINIFNKQTNSFSQPDADKNLAAGVINVLSADKAGDIWVGTSTGLSVFRSKTNSSENFDLGGEHDISAIYSDNLNLIWVGTRKGKIFQYDRKNRKFVLHQNLTFSYAVESFFEDERGNLWIVTAEEIARFRFSSKDTRHFIPEQQNNLLTGQIKCGMIDKFGVMWFGTESGGLLKYDDHKQRFTTLKISKGGNYSGADVVWSVFKDRRGNYYAGTEDGIYVLEPSKDHFSKIPLPEGYEDVNTFTGFFEISENEVAVSLSSRGMWKIDLANRHLERAYDTLSMRQSVYALLKDKKNYQWFAANNCIARVATDAKTGKRSFKYYHRKGKRFSYQSVVSIHEDKNGFFWFATPDSGLVRAKRNAEDDLADFTYFSSVEEDGSTLSHNYIFHTSLDPDGKTLWVATANGLNKFDTETGIAERLGEVYEQANLPIYGILQDESGVLWMSANVGIIKFDPKKKQFTNFTSRDGLQSNEFNQYAFFKAHDGEMLFGGVKGMNVFNPGEFTPNNILPRVVITDFKIFNQRVSPGENSPLSTDICMTDRIELSHKQYIFSFEFVGLSFRLSDKNQYAYKMEGFESEWNMAGGRRYANYSNLPPGEYVFKVKAANNDGIWNEQGTNITIIIHPPFWKTWWFIVLSVIFVSLSAYGIYKKRVAMIQMQKKVLERIVTERTHELQMQKEELTITLDLVNEQKAKIEMLNKDFIASLNAAVRIQEATLPFTVRLDRQIGIGKYFIFYKPRDLVSGDFYWFDVVDDVQIMIVADCTGHGVPGAFMSMIGMNLLEEIVKTRKNVAPEKILEKMQEGVRYALGQDKNSDIQESMDMIVLTRNIHENKVAYAGAMIPLYYFAGGDIFEVKAAKNTVGGMEFNSDEPFCKHEIEISTRTVFYLCSDGFKDQFGGINRKKFMAKNLKNLFHSVGHLDLGTQRKMIEKTFHDWLKTAGENQTDDVTVVAWEILPL
jgi:ligand-binding sensor domain-containing protein/serine phosphatase RsbU (regulator of sigma subunit)